MARYCPLFSGSSGNCTYVGTPEGGILIDVGVSASRIENALRMRGIDPCSIHAIFITHEHSDHIAGLRVLTKRYGYRVYASEGTLDALAASSAVDAKALCESIGGEGEVKETAGMAVMAFHTSHDSRESLGFRIHLPDGRRIAVATDTGYVPSAVREALLGCDLIQIESNHDVRMLENGPYPYYLKRRILAATGHLSNEDCAAELVDFARAGTTRFVLAHLSRDNNSPDLAYMTSRMALCGAGLEEKVDYILQVAPRNAEAPVMVF